MSTSRNDHSDLIEAEACRGAPEGFQVRCFQVDRTEDFIIRLVRGSERWDIKMPLDTYEDHPDWRVWLLGEIRLVVCGERQTGA